MFCLHVCVCTVYMKCQWKPEEGMTFPVRGGPVYPARDYQNFSPPEQPLPQDQFLLGELEWLPVSVPTFVSWSPKFYSLFLLPFRFLVAVCMLRSECPVQVLAQHVPPWLASCPPVEPLPHVVHVLLLSSSPRRCLFQKHTVGCSPASFT